MVYDEVLAARVRNCLQQDEAQPPMRPRSGVRRAEALWVVSMP